MMKFIKENIALFRFLFTCLIGYILWFLLYTLWLEPSKQLDFWLSHLEAQEVSLLFQILGYKSTLILEEGYKYAFYINGHRTIGLANNCNGLVLFPLFSVFIIATSGKWKHKLAYILIGCIAIYHINIIRIVSLIFIKMSYPESLDFNHKYTFTVLVYAFIFLLWHLWIKHFSNASLRLKNE